MINISTYGMLDVIFNNIDHVLFVSNEDIDNFNLLYINDTIQTIGIKKDVLYKEPFSFFNAIHSDDKKSFIEYFILSVKSNKTTNFDIRIIKSNDKLYWLHGKFIPVKGPSGKVNRIVGVATDVTDRKNEELRIRNLYKVQGDVMKILAHDLRTPISGIKILAESVSTSKELNQTHLKRIISNCKESLNLMEDLLSYIETDSEHMKINLTPIIVEDYINYVLKSFSSLILEKNILINVSSSKTNFNLDPLRFNQILSNIISNAIKFSYENGYIFISVESDDDNLIIEVSDEGIGISDILTDEIFDAFTTYGRSGTYGEKSTGLGLSITKRLVEFHNGEISIFSNDSNGTSVKIVFPVN